MIKEKEDFDTLLINWLVYYNSKRPYFYLNLKTPLQYMLDNYKMANMCLTSTSCGKNKLKYYIIRPVKLGEYVSLFTNVAK